MLYYIFQSFWSAFREWAKNKFNFVEWEVYQDKLDSARKFKRAAEHYRAALNSTLNDGRIHIRVAFGSGPYATIARVRAYPTLHTFDDPLSRETAMEVDQVCVELRAHSAVAVIDGHSLRHAEVREIITKQLAQQITSEIIEQMRWE